MQEQLGRGLWQQPLGKGRAGRYLLPRRGLVSPKHGVRGAVALGGVRGVFQQRRFLCLLSCWGRCQKGRGCNGEEAGWERGGSLWGCSRLSLLPAEPLVLWRGDRARSRAQPHAAGTPGQVGRAAGTASVRTPGAFLHLHLPCWHGVMPSGLSAPATTSPRAGVALSTAEPPKPSRWKLNLSVKKHPGPSHLLAVAGRMLSACPRGSWQAPRDHASCFRRTNGSVGSVSDLGPT